MAKQRKKAKTRLTFAVTVPQGQHTIKEIRGFLIKAIEQDFPPEEIKAWLLNKETTYA